MSSAEFTEWIAYNSIEPIGETRGDIQAARICQLLAAAHARRGKRYKLSDFMPDWWDERKSRAQTPAEMAAILMAAFAASKR